MNAKQWFLLEEIVTKKMEYFRDHYYYTDDRYSGNTELEPPMLEVPDYVKNIPSLHYYLTHISQTLPILDHQYQFWPAEDFFPVINENMSMDIHGKGMQNRYRVPATHMGKYFLILKGNCTGQVWWVEKECYGSCGEKVYDTFEQYLLAYISKYNYKQ